MSRLSLRIASLVTSLLALAPAAAFAQATLGDSAPAGADTAGFGSGTGARVASQLSPSARDLAEQIYRQLGGARAPVAVGNAAVGLWMVGRLQVALHLMGKAVADDPANTDNQCNYAAMLTMSGGAELAIPTLEKLAGKFPENSTVLNNLGQAYYLAGDEEKADKTLTRALAVAPSHPQAAATQSQIASSKGDNAKAVALARAAVQRSVSRDKLNNLRKLGYKLTLEDLKGARPTNPDPLGLENFVHPAFPIDATEENRTHREWAAFNKNISTRVETLLKRVNTLQAPLIAAAMAQARAATGQGPGAAPETGVGKPDATVHPRARKAKLMLDLLDRDSAAKARLRQAKASLDAFVREKQQLVATGYRPEYEKLIRQEANQTGEGLANRDMCEQFVALADKYLAKWSDGRTALYDAYLRELRLKLSEEVYWKQFVQSREEFQLTVLKAQIEWLGAFAASGVPSDGDIGIAVNADCLRRKQEARGGALTNFNDVHCQYHSELHLGIGSIITDCDRMVSTLGVGPVNLGLNQDMAQGTDFFDSFVSCNVEVSAGKSVGANVGPLSVEVGAEAGLGVEIGRDGIQDVYVTGKIEATAMDVVGSGAEGRMSLMSGSSSMNLVH